MSIGKDREQETDCLHVSIGEEWDQYRRQTVYTETDIYTVISGE